MRISKKDLFAKWNISDPSWVQREAFKAINSELALSEQQVEVAEHWFKTFGKFKIPNDMDGILAASIFANWINSCK